METTWNITNVHLKHPKPWNVDDICLNYTKEELLNSINYRKKCIDEEKEELREYTENKIKNIIDETYKLALFEQALKKSKGE